MINILTYTTPHRKTFDTLCMLKANGYSEVNVWAVPMSYQKRYQPLIEHRPKNWNSSKEMIGFLASSYQEIKDYSEIDTTGIFLCCGAGILPGEFLKKHTVINVYPGYIPNVRGLDAYKWAIFENQPIGVTTHIIGDELDAGEIIERRTISVGEMDTFHSVAQRVYETEIEMLVDAIKKVDEPHEYVSGSGFPVRKRMPHEKEVLLLERFEQYKEKHKPAYFIHESSYIDSGVTVGNGTYIWHFSHIQRGASIGENCILGQNVNISNDVTIGNGCKIQNNVSIYKGVTLEDYVFCGPSCVFTNVLTPRAEFSTDYGDYTKTLVKHGASIGANATIVCGVTIGEYALIGAGAVVTKDVPDYALVVGAPAKVVGEVDKHGVIRKRRRL